jgi:hypothetical protein
MRYKLVRLRWLPSTMFLLAIVAGMMNTVSTVWASTVGCTTQGSTNDGGTSDSADLELCRFVVPSDGNIDEIYLYFHDSSSWSTYAPRIQLGVYSNTVNAQATPCAYQVLATTGVWCLYNDGFHGITVTSVPVHSGQTIWLAFEHSAHAEPYYSANASDPTQYEFSGYSNGSFPSAGAMPPSLNSSHASFLGRTYSIYANIVDYTATPTNTPTSTPTGTPTLSPTGTRTMTPTVTPTASPTCTSTPTFTTTPIVSATGTGTFTPTGTLTSTSTPTASVSATPLAPPPITASTTATMPPAQGKLILAYPIPGRSVIHFSFNLAGPAEVKVELYNTRGEHIARLQGALNPAAEKLDWNCSQAAPGIYFAQVFVGGKSKDTLKVAVTR